MSDLLKDAIADARAIRATALANAKMALEEAFAPQLQRLISDKIQYEADEEGEEDAIVAPEDEVPAEEPVAEPAPEEIPAEEPVADVPVEEPAPEVETEPEEEEPVAEKIQKFGLTGPQKGFKEVVQFGGKATPDAGNDPEAAKGSNPSVPGGKEDTMAQAMKENEEMNDGLDLESIIKELEADATMDDNLFEEKEEEEEEEKEEKEDEKNEVVQFGGKVTADAGNDPEAVAGKNPSVPGGKEDMKPVMESGEEEVDLDEILAELEAEDANVDDKTLGDFNASTAPSEYEQINSLKSELASVNASLSEHKKIVNVLKTRLSEVNLLNSKLLFTNKLFKSHNLNNSQKMKVIENFDRARNVREVKLVYATIAESLSQTDLVKKAKPSVKKITEGLASKTSKSTKPAVEKVVKESSIIDDGSAARLKKLAGIK